jgi:peroxiredoxin
MNLITKRLLYFLLFVGIYSDLQAQIIAINNKKYAFKEIELSYHYADGAYQLKKTTLNESGFGLIHNKKLESGLYYIYYNDSTYTEFFYDASDPGKITINYNQETNTFDILGPETTVQYNSFSLQLDVFQYNSEKAQPNTFFHRKKSAKNNTIKSHHRRYNNLKDSLIDLSLPTINSSFLKAYLQAQRSISIPEYTPSEDIEIEDSTIWNFQINYYRKHYMDNIDLSNPHLIHTPVYTEKINFFLDIITARTPKELLHSIRYLIKKADSDSTTYQFILAYLLDKYNQKKNNAIDESVYLSIIEEYYLQSEENKVTDQDIDVLKRDYNRRKPSSLGETAPEFEILNISGNNLSLSNISGEILLLYFLSYECPVCDKVTQGLKKLANRYYYLDLKIVTICVGEDQNLWKKYINTKGIGNWVNLFGGNKMFKIAMDYNLSFTPTIFILDEHKTITHKNININQLEDILLDAALKANE